MEKKQKPRNDIRVSSVPDALFEAITKNAIREVRSQGAEILAFLIKHKYK
jgi:hypothetical protein